MKQIIQEYQITELELQMFREYYDDGDVRMPLGVGPRLRIAYQEYRKYNDSKRTKS